MRTIDEGAMVYRFYDSVDEFVQFAESVPDSRYSGEKNCCDNRSFVGRRFSGWQDAVDATRTAWPEGLEVLERMLHDLDDTALGEPRSRRRRTRFRDDDGDELDYDRMRSGQSFWRTSRREWARGPVTITVIVDVCASCGVNHNDILWRGAAAIALTKKLEAAGYRVELWATEVQQELWKPNSRNPITLVEAVCLKRPGDPIDESTLITAVSGWFYRTIAFRAMCSGQHSLSPALGFPRSPKSEELDHISRDENRILIADCWTYGTAVDKVRGAIETLKTR